VLVLAGGAPWEAGVLGAFEEAGIVVLRRCVDVVDLIAAASTGQAEVAVVAGDVDRFDGDAVLQLRRYDVAVLALAEDHDADRLLRLGAARVAPADPVLAVEAVQRVLASGSLLLAELDTELGPELDPGRPPGTESGGTEPEGSQEPVEPGRVIAVWGPAGAPGRTTVAIGIAAEVAATGSVAVLLDLDPYGGAVAQRLGIIDEVSGLLAVARAANTGTLDRAGLLAAVRRASPGLLVLTGLPRADRRIEVRSEVTTRLIGLAAGSGCVVVDTGFCLEAGEAERDRMTVEALQAADEVVVVGQADPVGLARLARALVELEELRPGAPVRVLVNRVRSGLGWSTPEIVDLVHAYARPLSVHLVPDDAGTCDRSQVEGRSLVELGSSPVRRAVSEVARACFPTAWAEASPVAGRRRSEPRRRRR
jgi:MinD-like ATPase involved in chromosome partitioning or flagellar assembly